MKAILGVGFTFLIGLALFLWRGGSDVIVKPESFVNSEDVDLFVSRIKERMIFVEGGSFLMGDYGSTHGEEKIQLDSETHSKPLHEVALSGYYIDKYKITNEDFRVFLKYHGKGLRGDVNSSMFLLYSSLPRLPARMDWFEADNYCSWLANVSGLPFSMPTEAQWEYAARSRGQFLMVATDDGTYRYSTAQDGITSGLNISTSADRKKYGGELGWDTGSVTPLPVDQFPPNPLGVYSMSDNGREWVKDWFDPEYYKYSPLSDPQGPEKPVHQDPLGNYTKVMRGQSNANEYWTVGVNVHRFPVNPYSYSRDDKIPNLLGKTARCVINSQQAVN